MLELIDCLNEIDQECLRVSMELISKLLILNFKNMTFLKENEHCNIRMRVVSSAMDIDPYISLPWNEFIQKIIYKFMYPTLRFNTMQIGNGLYCS